MLISDRNVRRARLAPRPFGRAKQAQSRNTQTTALTIRHIIPCSVLMYALLWYCLGTTCFVDALV